jgi:hypothetical protein
MSKIDMKISVQKPAACAHNGTPPAGAITLIADAAYWNALPGHVTSRPLLVTLRSISTKARPDFTPPAALDPAATAVEMADGRLEMDMHFDYSMASKALATAILDSVGASNQAALKVAFHPKPLHFLTQQEMVDEMLRKHAALTGPDLQKLRAPLHESLFGYPEKVLCTQYPSTRHSTHFVFPHDWEIHMKELLLSNCRVLGGKRGKRGTRLTKIPHPVMCSMLFVSKPLFCFLCVCVSFFGLSFFWCCEGTAVRYLSN